jgi:hypothetical protein
MLTKDIKFGVDPRMAKILGLIAESGGHSNEIRLYEGGIAPFGYFCVFEIGHFSLDHMLNEPIKNKYPTFTDTNFNCYGVCDRPAQIINACPELVTDETRKFVISITPIEKKSQPSDGGWRWHKWGPYIGTQDPCCEYIYDEPKIERVYCYHIYELEM